MEANPGPTVPNTPLTAAALAAMGVMAEAPAAAAQTDVGPTTWDGPTTPEKVTVVPVPVTRVVNNDRSLSSSACAFRTGSNMLRIFLREETLFSFGVTANAKSDPLIPHTAVGVLT